MNLLTVNDLDVRFDTPDGKVVAVNRLNFSLQAGETLGLVGESGSGKTQTAFALMGLLAKNGSVSGSAFFSGQYSSGQNLLALSDSDMNKIRANQIAMIFQDPMTSLNPYMKVGPQLMEVLQYHKGMDKRAAFAESVRMLDAVKMPEAQKRMSMYPHEFSGGMRQRIVIAMALLCQPKLLIADEPTTALDVTVQAQIMALLQDLKQDFGTSIILISHDLGIIAGLCDKVLVMYAGQTMEYGATDDIFYRPSHPYTQALLTSIPRINSEARELTSIPGNPPNLLNLPQGCPFQERCQHTLSHCQRSRPELQTFEGQRQRACFWQPESRSTDG
ncbi:oligopeptide transporter ATP-binding component [Endozoicomonas montiporae]|uniref:Oligopeptide transporter ATP-binding component n=2 Tax=Endozoicomonas montiporae TaxID=1027273 RepID=A0A081N090_9GAMM|nr:oligopeptide/dipeptide ABC transporter ATP-binding protein [Endozoicomonas montiporae]AMO54315.1 oligopeptide ABC transporter ATP-binding protein [Endozoicomonas montiporae CL-33]KEQ11863.1 oligopeptide transporter ATP-binding component [Endozoicomonas montiporae]